MKILHVDAEFIPHLGYQVNVISKFMANKGHDVSIISTSLKHVRKHQQVYLKDKSRLSDEDFYKLFRVKVYRVKTFGIISDRHIWSLKLFKQIKYINPDVIFFHDNDTLVSMLFLYYYYKKINIPFITDSHMIEFASKNKFKSIFRWVYRKTITPKIVKNNITIVRTVEDNFIKEAFNIPLEQAPVVSFGSDIDLFKPDSSVKSSFRIEHKISIDERVFVYAGKLSKDKNGIFFAKSITELFTDTKFKPVFVIIGDTQGEYGNEVERLFSKSENKIIRFPLQSYLALPNFFQASDVGIIPAAASLTYFDMIASGTPIIWPNLNVNAVRSSNEFTSLFQPDSQIEFRKSILNYLNMSDNELISQSKKARDFCLKNFSYEKITDQFINIMKNEISYRKNHGFK